MSYNLSLLDDRFIHACQDYFFLMNRYYPERGAIKMVGDRYKLTRDQRTVLYRGISSEHRSAVRRSLLVHDFADRSVAVDGYNVLFSLLNYRLGRFTFIATDNILRDAGSLHGRLKDESTFLECIGLMMEFLVGGKPAAVDVFFDSPVSHSQMHAGETRKIMEKLNIHGSCYVIRSADFALKNFPYEIVATSDTVIIEKADRPVIDLARMILEEKYQAELIKMIDLVV